MVELNMIICRTEVPIKSTEVWKTDGPRDTKELFQEMLKFRNAERSSIHIRETEYIFIDELSVRSSNSWRSEDSDKSIFVCK